MNEQLQNFAREELKSGLALCTDTQQNLFKRMYSHSNLERSIDDVVDSMPDSKLDMAMRQVQRTLDKKESER